MKMQKPDRTLILVRHAHRPLENRSADNGLSRKGKRQVKVFAKWFRREFGKKAEPTFVSSPKRRCVETLAPLTRRYDRPVQPLAAFEERHPWESARRFENRIRRALAALPKGPLIVVCGHGDGLPVALRLLTGARALLKKGGWAQVTFTDPPRLVTLAQPQT